MKRIDRRIKGFWFPWLIAAFILSSCGTANVTASTTPTSHLEAGKRVVGYYAQWAAEGGYFVANIPATKITHINYAFSNVSPAGECVLGDPAADVERVYSAGQSVNGRDDSSEAGAFHGNFNQLRELKLKYPHLKVLISVGGWDWSENFSAAALTDASRQAFARSCIDLLKQYKGVFDGIDLDWEFPVTGGLTDQARPEDKHNFTLLLAELRRQLDELGSQDGRYYLLTIAAGSGPGMDVRYERNEIARYLDWINLMTYDLHGTWELATNFNAPLYQAAGDPGSPSLNVDAVVEDYLASGVPADKLVMGMPFFGRAWKGVGAANNGLFQPSEGPYGDGSLTYTEIVADYLPTYTRYWNSEAQVPWLYNLDIRVFVSYDDPESITAKARYAKDKHLAGVMIWELSQGNDEMLEAIQTGFQSGSAP